MKTTEIVLMVFILTLAFVSMVICVYNDQSWFWQLSSMLLVYAIFLKNKTIQKYEKILKNLTKK